MQQDNKPRKKIALYVRTSTDNQSMGLAGQELELHNYVKAHPELNNKEVLTFIDEGKSGKLRSRPAFNELMHCVKREEIETLLVYSISRLARSLPHLLQITTDLSAHHCALISLKDPINTSSPAGVLSFHLLAAVAEFESSISSERTRSALSAARHKGTILGRPSELSLELRLRVLEERSKGVSLRVIAQMLDISSSMVYRTIKKSGVRSA